MIDKSASISDIKREIARRQARASFYDYVLYTNPGFKDTAFHRYLCNEVNKFLATDISPAFDILLISTPPQHGKSRSITETLPSWYLGRNPDKSVIITGYSEDFAKRFGRRNLRKLETYSKELFPEFEPEDSPWTNLEFESTIGGRCISRGILSGITGNPANLFIIDDPTKNMQEAMSETTRAAILDEFFASIVTRIAPHGKLIVIQTRWHEDDLFGYIARNFKGAQIINIPCEAVDENDVLGRKIGDALCPEIGKDNNWLTAFKSAYIAEKGAREWNALYQGNPSLNKGNLFLKDKWRFYKKLPGDVPYRILSVDCAFKKTDTSDYVAIQEWGKRDREYYLTRNRRERLSFTETVEAIREMMTDEIAVCYIEDKANGPAVTDALSREFDNIVLVNPEGGKLSRAAAISYLVETGHVWLPEGAEWLDDYINEHAKFPLGANDDQVDATSQALNRLVLIPAYVEFHEEKEYTAWSDDMWQDYNDADEKLKKELITLWKCPLEWQLEEYER